MTRDEKLKRIYEVIGYNKSIQDYTRRLSDYEWELKWIMIWDVLDWIENNSDLYLDRFCIEDCIMETINKRKELRTPIEDQSDSAIDFIESLLPIKE